MSYSYVVTAQKSTSVTKSLTGNFTSPTETNLIICKSTRLEIHTLTPEGLQPFLDIGIYGRISTIQLFRPASEEKDLLFISTEKYKFCVLSFDSNTGEIVTRANGDLRDPTGKPAEHASGIIDPKNRAVVLHLYTGWIKVMKINELSGKFSECYNVRLQELHVFDIQFLEGCKTPTIIVLYQTTSREERLISVYELSLEDKELVKTSWPATNVEAAASMLIPVPAPYGGVLVVGEMTIAYLNGKRNITINMEPSNMVAFGKVDPDGSRYLLGDLKGNLFALVLEHDQTNITNLSLERLGATSIPSTLTYLDNGVVFVGSSYGDSQLVKLQPQRDIEGSYLEFMDSFTNLGPIVDFSVVDLERHGQGQVVTCSGAFKDGSLRVIRNGIGINEQAAIELPGIKGVWSLKNAGSSFDKFLVVSFVKQTRVLAITDEEMGEVEIAGLDSVSQTLLCQNLTNNRILQITEKEARVISSESFKLLHQWTVQGDGFINVASANSTQAVFSVGGGKLVYLDFSGEGIQEVARTTMEHEISCLNIHPLEGKERADYCAVGLWTDISVRILRLPSLEESAKELLAGEFLPRSVLFTTFESGNYLLCALGDGHFYSYRFTPETSALYDRKKLSLGTQPISLNTFESKNSTHVFAASDRPTVIYCHNKKLLYSTVNLKDVDYMCSFNTEAYPDSLVIVSGGNLTIGTIDDIQKLHIRTIPLGEMPRRISHHETSRTFGLLVVNFSVNDSGNDVETSFLRILDDQTFDVEDSFQFRDTETVCSILSMKFESDPQVEYLIVGTAISRPDEAQPREGRILVFSISDKKKIQLVCESEIAGAAFCLAELNGKLLAGINNYVTLYNWTSSCELVSESSCEGNILVTGLVTRGDLAVVADLIRSISVLHWDPVGLKIEEIARDYNPRWMTAADLIDSETFVGAENGLNLFTVNQYNSAESAEERSRLETIGEYHLGEMVNKFRNASLVMKPPDGEAIPTTLFATVTGAIGVIASISKEDYDFFLSVQNSINQIIKGVGGLHHEDWRRASFTMNASAQSEGSGFIDGDLVESFLDLKPEKMAEVVKHLDISVEELCKRIEDLAQAIH